MHPFDINAVIDRVKQGQEFLIPVGYEANWEIISRHSWSHDEILTLLQDSGIGLAYKVLLLYSIMIVDDWKQENLRGIYSMEISNQTLRDLAQAIAPERELLRLSAYLADSLSEHSYEGAYERGITQAYHDYLLSVMRADPSMASELAPLFLDGLEATETREDPFRDLQEFLFTPGIDNGLKLEWVTNAQERVMCAIIGEQPFVWLNRADVTMQRLYVNTMFSFFLYQNEIQRYPSDLMSQQIRWVASVPEIHEVALAHGFQYVVEIYTLLSRDGYIEAIENFVQYVARQNRIVIDKKNLATYVEIMHYLDSEPDLQERLRQLIASYHQSLGETRVAEQKHRNETERIVALMRM
jgi:hypothetical protein